MRNKKNSEVKTARGEIMCKCNEKKKKNEDPHTSKYRLHKAHNNLSYRQRPQIDYSARSAMCSKNIEIHKCAKPHI